MAEMIPFCYLLGTVNNFLVVGFSKKGLMNFVSQVIGRTADAKCSVSSSSASESMNSSARTVKRSWRHPFVIGSFSSLILCTFLLSLSCARSACPGNKVILAVVAFCMVQDGLTLRGEERSKGAELGGSSEMGNVKNLFKSVGFLLSFKA